MWMLDSLPDFSKAAILIFGDVMLDRYWYGQTKRISPEAPVPVVNIGHTLARAGGAANVGLNIAALGGRVALFGFVGDDVEATELLAELHNAQIDCYLQTLLHTQTITKLRVIGQNQQLIRLDFENKDLIQIDDAVLLQFEKTLDQVGLVVLSDYAKGALARAPELIALAKARQIPILVDPKQKDFSFYRGASLLTPNLSEFEAVAGSCRDDADMIVKARSLMAAHDIGAFLITRGKAGMIYIPVSGEVLSLGTYAREVFDVTGAGDTVIGVLAAGLATGLDMSQAIELANMAAGLVVAKLGAETVSLAELRRFIQIHHNSSQGILSNAVLSQTLEDARAHSERIVMTNGCFDILHSGHVQYLQQARALGDRLLVAVNSDESVRRLKGEGRPFNTLSDRMAVLSALGCVDWVISFSEDTPINLINRVMPDVLVKGGDYTIDTIVGAKEVMHAGGHVEVLPFLSGRSTTGLVNKMLEEWV